MRDDLLDVTDFQSNKTSFSDLQEWNQTVVLFEALKTLNATDAATLLQYRGKPITPDVAHHLHSMIEQSGAIKQNQKADQRSAWSVTQCPRVSCWLKTCTLWRRYGDYFFFEGVDGEVFFKSSSLFTWSVAMFNFDLR